MKINLFEPYIDEAEEKAVLETILGKEVSNKDALANPKSLLQYSDLPF